LYGAVPPVTVAFNANVSPATSTGGAADNVAVIGAKHGGVPVTLMLSIAKLGREPPPEASRWTQRS